MKVQSINSYTFKSVTEEHRKPPIENEQVCHTHPKNRVNPVSLTGWVGSGALITSIVSGIKHLNILHKFSAYIAAGSIAAHIGIIQSYKHSHHHSHYEDS